MLNKPKDLILNTQHPYNQLGMALQAVTPVFERRDKQSLGAC